MKTWIAEDVPWFQIDQSSRIQGMSDEDNAMSAPVSLGEFAVRSEAAQALAGRLERSSRYDFIVRTGQQGKYLLAAQAILLGADGVRIGNRYYRVRCSVG